MIAGNEWSYDVSQPPLVYTGKVGGKTRHVVSVASMEGVWYAFDANTGQPIYQRVKVLDRIEHPALRPGQPVAVFPSSIGGLNYSPASYDPATDYVINAAAETAGVDVQVALTPTEKKDKFLLGSVFLGLENGNFGQVLPGWHDHGSISAIDVNTGQRVWKFETPEPERGGVTTTASGLGFAGGGDGVLRAFDTKTGKILWTFQTGHQIAAGPTIFTGRDGKEYLAISVGGTPTSSGGGTAAELQVFGLGGSAKQSTPPVLAAARLPATATAPNLVVETPKPVRTGKTVAAAGAASIVTGAPLAVRLWSTGEHAARQWPAPPRGQAGRGAAMQVDNYTLQARTDAAGRFSYLIDPTLPRRHVVRVAASLARVCRRPCPHRVSARR